MAAPAPSGHYVYLHRRASDGVPFYVGKGAERRAWGLTGRNPWWRRVADKHGYVVQIVRDGMSEPCALSLERALIRAIGRDRLVNLVDGGGGIRGWRHSVEAKARISAANKGKTPSPRALAALRTNDGRPLTEAHRRKLAAAKAGRLRGPHSEETRRKISASHMGVRPSAETLRKMSAAKVGKRVGKDSASYDHTIRRFSHGLHGVFVGTRGDLILAYGLGSSDMAALLKGKQKSVRGWRLA